MGNFLVMTWIAKKLWICFVIGVLLTLSAGSYLSAQDAPAPSQEVIALKSQIETMREYDQKLLATVYWSLTTVAGLAVVLVGYSWFTNWRVYERDKAALQEDMEAKLIIRFASLKADLEATQVKTFKDLFVEIDTKLSSNNKEMDGRLRSLDSSLAQIHATIDANLKWVNEVNAEQNLQIRYYTLQAEAYYWEIKGVPGNEIDRCRDMLAVAFSLKSGPKITAALAKLITFMQSGTFPFWAEVPQLIDILDKLPSKYASQRDVVKELLKQVKGA